MLPAFPGELVLHENLAIMAYFGLVNLSLHEYTEESRCWRTPIGEKTGDGSNSNGRTVRLGLRNKPLRRSRVNGSARCISMDWISLMP